MPSVKHALGALIALALLAAAPGDNPRTPEVPQAAADNSWAAEPSVASLLEAAKQQQPRGAHAEQFYFVLPDRFADGDPSNNTGGLSGDRLSTGYDPTDKGFY